MVTTVQLITFGIDLFNLHTSFFQGKSNHGTTSHVGCSLSSSRNHKKRKIRRRYLCLLPLLRSMEAGKAHSRLV